MKRAFQSFLAVVVILGTGVPLWYFVVVGAPSPPVAPPRDLGPVPVVTAELESRSLDLEVHVYGTLLPLQRVRVACELAGRLERVHPEWRPGTWVDEGEELLVLEQKPFAIALSRAAALLEEARAGLEVARSRLEHAREEHAKAQERLDIAAREQARLVNLEAMGITSRSQIDQARNARLLADIAAGKARSALDIATSEEAAARARVEQAEASKAQAEHDLVRSRVRAPFGGRLVSRAPSAGAFLAPGATFGELLDVSKLVLSASLPEDALPDVRLGQPAEVRLATRPELSRPEPLVGVVTAVGPESDPITRSGRVEIEIDNRRRDPPLASGLFAEASIRVGRLENAVVVQRKHIRWLEGVPVAFVLVRGEGGPVAELRELDLTREVGEGFVVSGGLDAGESLITRPLDRLWDGAPCGDPRATPSAGQEPSPAGVGGSR